MKKTLPKIAKTSSIKLINLWLYLSCNIPTNSCATIDDKYDAETINETSLAL